MTKIVYEDFPGNTTEYAVNFEYLNRSDVYVGQITEEEVLIDIPTNWIWKDDTTIQFADPPGGIIRIFRSTDIDEPISTFYPTVAIRAIDLNNNFDQLVFSLQEEKQKIIDLNVDIDNIEDDLEQLTEIIVNTIQFVPVANVAELNAAALTDPDDLKGYEIKDSTNINTLSSPVIVDLPPAAGSNPGDDPVNGVYWNSGIVTRVFWVKNEQQWKFILYYSGDADNRYQQMTLSNPVTPDPADYKDGTLWFDASDANLYVLYNDGNSRQWVITNPLSAYGQIVTSDDVYWARDAANNTVYPKQSTDNIANNNGSAVINADGTATFADGDIEFFDGGAAIYKGALNVYRDQGSNAGLIIGVDGANKTILKADGSGTFASGVCSIKNTGHIVIDRTATSDNILIGRLNGTTTSYINANGSAEFTGIVSADRPVSGTPANTWSCFVGQNNGATTSSIKADGSATFDGIIDTGKYLWSKNTNSSQAGCYIYNYDGNASRNNLALEISPTQSSTTATCKINYDGSAEFSNNQTIQFRPTKSDGESAYAMRLLDSTDASLWQVNADGDSSQNGNATFTGVVESSNSASAIKMWPDGLLTIGKFSAGDLIKASTNIGGTPATPFVLDSAGSATFTGTVTANGTILTRASGDLDVGDRLEKADNALKALKAAALAATDFDSLKTAILTSLQEV